MSRTKLSKPEWRPACQFITEHQERNMPNCTICGEPMEPGEEMFKYHGSLGPCPKPPLPNPEPELCSKCGQPIEEGDAYRAHGSNLQHASVDGCLQALGHRVAALEEQITKTDH